MNLNQNKGFSLIELMVVVAIIGILATVAVPNFMKFQAKAKQTNAKVELSAIFTAEQAFYAENNSYHGYLSYIGFVPDGCTDLGVCAGNTRLYASGFVAAGITGAFGGVATTGKTAFVYPSNAPIGAIATVTNAVDPTTDTFTAASVGKISSSASNDVWTMSNLKVLNNAVVGY